MRRILPPLLLGLLGVAVLLQLGFWQMRRLEWKEALLADISARIAAAPVPLPAAPDPQRDRYLSVTAEGVLGEPQLTVLVSRKGSGAGFRVIAPFQTEGRRVLVDRGWIGQGARGSLQPGGAQVVTGNLHWPDEVDGFTPEPDPKAGIWFARDLPRMAAELGTEPVLIVARLPTGAGIEPMPVGTEGIPNDHLSYAVTWFSLALVWAGMTGLWLWRIHRRTG